MPKSKKNKIVHLTQVKKKGKDHKDDLMKQLEEYVAQFKMVYIFDFDQTKSDRIMNLRLKMKGIGRIFAGRNSIVSATFKAIGSRTNTNFEDLTNQVAGHRGLLFTDMKADELVALLDKELPEFLKKLLGYSRIEPETAPMELDHQDDDDDNDEGKDEDEKGAEEEEEEDDDEDAVGSRAERKKSSLKRKKNEKMKKGAKKVTPKKKSSKEKVPLKTKTKKSSKDKREVKFVKI